MWRVCLISVLVFDLCGVGLLAQSDMSCDLNHLPNVSEDYALQRAKVDPDPTTDEAICWWMTAAKKNNPEAQTRVGWLVYKNRPDWSVVYFDAAAMQGWAPAAEALSEAYKYGIGVAQSSQRAAQWHQAAIDQPVTLPPKPVPVTKDAQWTAAGQTIAMGALVVGAAFLAHELLSSGSSSGHGTTGSGGDSSSMSEAQRRYNGRVNDAEKDYQQRKDAAQEEQRRAESSRRVAEQ